MTQPVSGQNLKLPGREKDNLCENNVLASKPIRQLPSSGTHDGPEPECALRAGSELTSAFTKVKPLTILYLQRACVRFAVLFNLGNLSLEPYTSFFEIKQCVS